MSLVVVNECFVAPGSRLERPSGAHQESKSQYDWVKVGKDKFEARWPCTSLDIMTLENGFALDTCWIFERSIPEVHFKASLSVLLNEYRPFAGRFHERSKSVVLNDKGVKFQVCEDDVYDIKRALTEHHTESFANRFVDYSSWVIGMRVLDHPLMTVRLSYLANGGCVLAVRATHGLADGDTFYSMIDRWAALARGTSEPCKVVFNQSQVPYSKERRSPSDVLSDIKEKGWSHVRYHSAAVRLALLLSEGVWLHHKVRTTPFHLSNEGLARLKLAAELDCKTSGRKLNHQGITSNEALSSFVSQVLAKLFDFADEEPCAHSTMYNWRGRLNGMSVSFAGNASTAIRTSDFFAGSTLGEIVARMNQTMEVFKSNDEEIREHIELALDSVENGIQTHMAEARTLPYLSAEPTTTVTNNFARYPIYNADFGYGRPLQVVPHHCGDQVIIWPAPNGDGVHLYFQGTTANRIAFLNNEDRTWFEHELLKFERHFDKEVIHAWFDAKVSKSKMEKGVKETVLSPIGVTRRPSSAVKHKSAISWFSRSFVRSVGAMLAI